MNGRRHFTSRLLIPFLLALSLSLAVAGCRAGDDTAGPPEIRYGEDVCDQCNMLISDPRFAAAYATEAGDTRRFDDIGGMFLYAGERDEAARAFWVHDFHDEAWVEATEATFVHNPDLTTPMGWGLAAFATLEDAQAYGDAQMGTVLTFAELQEQIRRGDLLPQGMAGHDHDGIN